MCRAFAPSVANGTVTRLTARGQQQGEVDANYNRYKYGGHIMVSCDSGYHITDEPTATTTWTATCQANGSWTRDEITCSSKTAMQ